MDTISNMLTSISNAQKIKKERVAIPYSTFKENLANFLQKENIIAKTRVQEGINKKLIITLSYYEGEPMIHEVKRISKPGKKRYIGVSEIPYTGHRPGMYIISTSQGLMDQNEARQKGVGGELVCAIWLNA